MLHRFLASFVHRNFTSDHVRYQIMTIKVIDLKCFVKLQAAHHYLVGFKDDVFFSIFPPT